MPQPGMLTYNELNGSETKQVCSNRFQDFLETVPYFQPHLTLPRVRITIQMKLEIWADQPKPEVVALNDHFDVVSEEVAPATVVFTAESVDSTAPGKGFPPDQLREMHRLPVPTPGRGPRDVGGQITINDAYRSLDGREVEDRPGLKVSRTGSGMIDGMPTSANAVVAKIDQGPAGLRMGQMNREAWHFGGGGKR